MTLDDEDGFREFVASRLGPLRRLAYFACGDWHTAEDAVANALAKLYPRWQRLERPDLYVQTMVFRAAIDETRRAWRREHSASDALPDVRQPDRSGEVDERLRIRAALLTLSPKQRAVLVLRYYAGLSVEETAEVLGAHAGTVKSHSAPWPGPAARGVGRRAHQPRSSDPGVVRCECVMSSTWSRPTNRRCVTASTTS